MDLGCAPACILKRHPSDERTNLVAYPWPTATRPGPPTPVQTKPSTMPTDYGLGFDDCQNLGPTRPKLPQGGPEEAIPVGQHGTRTFPFQNGDLAPTRATLQLTS